MRPFRWRCVLSTGLILMVASAAQAQMQIACIYPAGGRQGTSFELSVWGVPWLAPTDLDSIKVHISGAGVVASVDDYEFENMMAQTEVGKLKSIMQRATSREDAARARAARDKKQEELYRTLRMKSISDSGALRHTLILRVTIAPDATPGKRELRIASPRHGLSTPVFFFVQDQLPEISEPSEAFQRKNDESYLGDRRRNALFHPVTPFSRPEMSITLPALLNGQIMRGEVDRFRFTARKGQKLVVAAGARELNPYLGDAVPGWFRPVLELYDPRGKELAVADSYRFSPDPVLYQEIPEDGEYRLQIHDALYRGREYFVYRMTVGELPYVTNIFPLGGRAGSQISVEAMSWNLPAARQALDAMNLGPGVYPFSVRQGQWISNSVPFAVDTLPECLAEKTNHSLQTAQAVSLPIIINGRIERPGQWSVFRFEGRAGQEIVAEVYARRLTSPVDSMLRLTDATGTQLAFNDDFEDKGAWFETHHADSYLLVKLPADGAYFLHLGDTQRQAGPEYAYRLRISPPRPDFQLRVVPSVIVAQSAGEIVPFTVYALRKDGFCDDIALALKGAPQGTTLAGGWVPANQDKVRVTLAAPQAPDERPVGLSLEGRATIQGAQVIREAVAAEDRQQAFSYRHLVPTQQQITVVRGRTNRFTAVKRILSPLPIRIPVGAGALLQVYRKGERNQVVLALDDPPDGITIKGQSADQDRVNTVLQADASKVKPGLKGNLILKVMSVPVPAKPGEQPEQPRELGLLPAVPFEIVERE